MKQTWELNIDLSPFTDRGREAVFDWKSFDGRHDYHFRTDAMKRFVHQNKEFAKTIFFRTTLDAQQAQFIKENGGVEDAHIEELTEEDLEEPCLGVVLEDGVILVDGNHRYYKRWLVGKDTVDIYIFPEEVWRHFAISEAERDEIFYSPEEMQAFLNREDRRQN